MSQSFEDNYNQFSSQQDSPFSFFQEAPRRQASLMNRGLKNLKNATTFTQNTLKIQTKFNNFDQSLNKTKVQGHQIQAQDKNQLQKPSKPKNQLKIYNIIEPSIFKLRKISATKNGKRLQTMNLNKYYCCYLREYVRNLHSCQILEVEQYETYQQTLNNHELDLFEPSEKVIVFIQRYISSSSIVNKILLSRKMSFENKITAIKYLNILKQKLIKPGNNNQGWKKRGN